MKNSMLLSLILMTSVSVHAKFFPSSYVDPISDKQVYVQKTYSDNAQFGFRCDSARRSNEMYVVFGNKDTGSYIAGANSKLNVKLRVDRGKVHSLEAVMSNSNSKFVFIQKPSKGLMKELKAGSNVHLRAFKYGSKVYEHAFNLSGSSRAIDEVSSRCDLIYQSDSYSLLNREIMQLKRERDIEIRRIEREYSKKIAEVRAQYH
ncbi:hypothetical protein L1D55_03275 [Vibrio sp. Isolate22]|uniref:hypothetical protein n=1 Tax=Vibrio TaxID=662 RepID=UPI001EFD9212|nr:hypothetical protein [Vibrio sp. Isolate22]MCG9690809.1 hypothetical protein [Vibrio sp. Isolate22]